MKVSIIGIGRVGSTLAYTLAIRGICSEIVLVNRNHTVAVGEARDLQHTQPFVSTRARIRAGDLADTASSDVIAYCASTPLPPGWKSRLDLGPPNVELLGSQLPELAAWSPEGILVMVSNPVDVLTYYAIAFTGYPASRVVGTGTLIDSARFRMALSEEVEIHPDDVRAYILGEHGPSQFPVMSLARAGGELIEDSPTRRNAFEETRHAGVQIYREKGFTNYAIAMSTAAIIESIALDERRTMPLSVRIDDYLGESDVCLSVPVVVGRSGITRILVPDLNESEAAAFRASAAVIRDAIEAARPNRPS